MSSSPAAATASPSLSRKDPNYGTPVAGSKTEARAKQAHQRIGREVMELCSIIQQVRHVNPVQKCGLLDNQ